MTGFGRLGSLQGVSRNGRGIYEAGGYLTVFLICCVAVGGALAGSRPPAAALRHDPSFSASAQHAVSLHLNLPGTATFDPDNLIGDVNFAAVDSLNPSAVQQFLASQSGILDAHSTPDHSGVTRSAGAIICQAAKAWQVSPKVILATMQKEEGLLSAATPSVTALEWAMGCGVPGAGSSDTAYEGFGKAGLVRR
jgi:hypothetical protein